jgi:hypothetical protein
MMERQSSTSTGCRSLDSLDKGPLVAGALWRTRAAQNVLWVRDSLGIPNGLTPPIEAEECR